MKPVQDDYRFGILGIFVLNVIVWYSIFANGLFQTIMWLIIISAIIGLWMRLSGRV